MSTDALEQLPNLGPVTAGWLRAVGIASRHDLAAVGAVVAYQQVRLAGYPTSRTLLYALHGALINVPWHRLSSTEKARLRREAGV